MSKSEEKTHGREGQTLVEVLVATAVLLVGLWAIMTLMVPGLRAGRAAKLRALAVQLAEAERSTLMYQYPEAILAKVYSYDAEGDPNYEPTWSFEVKWDVSPDHTRINNDYLRYVKDVVGEAFVARKIAGTDANGDGFGVYTVNYAPVLAGSEIACLTRAYSQYEYDGGAVTATLLADEGVDDGALGNDTWRCLVNYSDPAATTIYSDDYQHAFLPN